jgi:hypothetical protein
MQGAGTIPMEARMKIHDERDRYLTRDKVLKLLSDDEIARVSTAESGAHLDPGAEYLELEALERGVQRAVGSDMPMGGVLPRKSVHEETWGRILRELARAQVALPHSGGRTDSSS